MAGRSTLADGTRRAEPAGAAAPRPSPSPSPSLSVVRRRRYGLWRVRSEFVERADELADGHYGGDAVAERRVSDDFGVGDGLDQDGSRGVEAGNELLGGGGCSHRKILSKCLRTLQGDGQSKIHLMRESFPSRADSHAIFRLYHETAGESETNVRTFVQNTR